MNHLERIVATTREAVERRKHEALTPAVRHEPRPFTDVLRRGGPALIAEHKRRSPSAGAINERLVLEDVVLAYERGGAAALSVLTEGPNFGGSLEDLRAARAASTLPILRKDFIVDPYQLDEASAAGADAVLLIVAALSRTELAQLHQHATGLGLDALVEVHDDSELERAAAAGARLIGVNNRDLRDFTVDVGRTAALASALPPQATLVSESGIVPGADLAPLAAAGVRAVLVGEALMRAADIEGACRALGSFELVAERS
jgi:indole-3-glycerol phosphate synthase